jgi:hypothetical protein
MDERVMYLGGLGGPFRGGLRPVDVGRGGNTGRIPAVGAASRRFQSRGDLRAENSTAKDGGGNAHPDTGCRRYGLRVGVRLGLSWCNQLAAQRDAGQINPAVLLLFADKSQFAYLDVAAAFEVGPAFRGYLIGLLRLRLSAHFRDSQVRHIGPFFLGGQSLGIQPVVQFAHAVGGMGHADENCRRKRTEGFNLTQRDRKRFHMAAHLFQSFTRRHFAPLKDARRQHGQMSCKMRERGMQLAPEMFDKLSDWISQVSHQGVTRVRHHPVQIIRCSHEWEAGLQPNPGGKEVRYNRRVHLHSRGVAQPGSAPALGARTPALNALLVLTISRKTNNLGSLLFAQNRSPRAPIRGVLTQFRYRCERSRRNQLSRQRRAARRGVGQDENLLQMEFITAVITLSSSDSTTGEPVRRLMARESGSHIGLEPAASAVTGQNSRVLSTT